MPSVGRHGSTRALTDTLNMWSCPIRGCNHADDGYSRIKFGSPTVIIRHLAGNDHNHSQHLVDHSIYQEVGIYSCPHVFLSQWKKDILCNQGRFSLAHRRASSATCKANILAIGTTSTTTAQHLHYHTTLSGSSGGQHQHRHPN